MLPLSRLFHKMKKSDILQEVPEMKYKKWLNRKVTQGHTDRFSKQSNVILSQMTYTERFLYRAGNIRIPFKKNEINKNPHQNTKKTPTTKWYISNTK